jgi:methylmalonyl-CoA mutase N-terminal domain/subunit
VELHSIDEQVAEKQVEYLKDLKERRDNEKVEECLQAIKRAAESGENTMYPTIEAVRAYATVQEICDAMKEVYGSYRETAVI